MRTWRVETEPPAVAALPRTTEAFDSTGTALQDVAAALALYEKAVRLGRGETIDLDH